MITGWKSIQDQGKTLCAVRQVMDLVIYHHYDPTECYGNVKINMPGYNFVSSEQLRGLMGDVVKNGWRHKVILIDEINRVYPARFWGDKERTMELLTIWQDVKGFMQIIYTTHVGNSVDLLVREATQFYCIPKYRPRSDRIDIAVVNGLDMRPDEYVLYPASGVFPYYDRWAFVN